MSNLYASPILLSHSRSIARDERWNPFASFQFPGDHTARVTPVPIPNTVVKPRWADDTARATVWERRSSPGLKYKKAGLSNQSGLFVLWRRRHEDWGQIMTMRRHSKKYYCPRRFTALGWSFYPPGPVTLPQ